MAPGLNWRIKPSIRSGGAALAALALLLAGCGEDPVPPRLVSFKPAIPATTAGGSTSIQITYEEPGLKITGFKWTAEAGQIEGDGKPEITYQAPDQAGTYKVTVTAAYGDDGAELSLDTAVRVAASTSAPTAEPTTETTDDQAPAVAATDEPAAPTTTAGSTPAPTATDDAPADAAASEDAPAAPTSETAATTETEAAPGDPAPGDAATSGPAATTAAADADAAAPAEVAAALEEPPAETAETEAAPDSNAPAPEVEAGQSSAGDTAGDAAASPPASSGMASAEPEAASEEAAEPTDVAAPEQPSTEPADVAAEAPEEVTEPAAATAAASPDAAADTESPAATEAASETAALEAPPDGDEGDATAEAAAPASDEATAPETAPAAPAVAALTAPTATEAPATEAPPTETTATGPSVLDAILDGKQLTAIVQIDYRPFSFLGDDGHRVGFDIDMVREFARRWLDDSDAVTLLAVPTDARIPTLLEGRGEVIAAALTDTPARRQEIDFSLTYFKDGQRLLVADGAAIGGVCDLAGKKVAAIRGSTSLDNLTAAASACGFAIDADLVLFRRHREAVDALRNGEVEAFTSDGIALENFASEGGLAVVGNHFSDEPYGFGLPKGDARLGELIDSTLQEMAADGTLAGIYQKWFGDQIRPYPIAAAPAVDQEVAALATTEAPTIVPAVTPGAPVSDYTVQPGDTLSKIAGKVYGDVSPASWERIHAANRATIGADPTKIEVGMRLEIPQP